MDTYRIYGLYDPRTLDTRYVGHTTQDVALRAWQHFNAPASNGLAEWMRELREFDQRPMGFEIDEVVGAEADALRVELHWIITYFANGAPLLNRELGRTEDGKWLSIDNPRRGNPLRVRNSGVTSLRTKSPAARLRWLCLPPSRR